MKSEDIAYIKRLLAEKLEKLVKQTNDNIPHMTSHKDCIHLSIGESFGEFDRFFMLQSRAHEGNLIKKINKALERIDNRSFGICRECGEDIAVERLMARPLTTHCIECKSRKAALEKTLGL